MLLLLIYSLIKNSFEGLCFLHSQFSSQYLRNTSNSTFSHLLNSIQSLIELKRSDFTESIPKGLFFSGDQDIVNSLPKLHRNVDLFLSWAYLNWLNFRLWTHVEVSWIVYLLSFISSWWQAINWHWCTWLILEWRLASISLQLTQC